MTTIGKTIILSNEEGVFSLSVDAINKAQNIIQIIQDENGQERIKIIKLKNPILESALFNQKQQNELAEKFNITH